MTVQNLAVCFAPSLFALSSPFPKGSSSLSRRGSFKRNTITPGLSPSQMATNKEVNDSVVSEPVLFSLQTLHRDFKPVSSLPPPPPTSFPLPLSLPLPPLSFPLPPPHPPPPSFPLPLSLSLPPPLPPL